MIGYVMISKGKTPLCDLFMASLPERRVNQSSLFIKGVPFVHLDDLNGKDVVMNVGN